jgi:hypothetical protein
MIGIINGLPLNTKLTKKKAVLFDRIPLSNQRGIACTNKRFFTAPEG